MAVDTIDSFVEEDLEKSKRVAEATIRSTTISCRSRITCANPCMKTLSISKPMWIT